MSIFRDMADFMDGFGERKFKEEPQPSAKLECEEAAAAPRYDPVDYRRVRADVLKEIVAKGSVLVRVHDKQYRVTSKVVEVTAR